ncbi:unnamed protein product, partial [Mesorhabditis belari]|uniref:Double-strand-break repair protein rad21 homolog n=1 Tax=Mesorhabditis belari TaxID=2138241 RepID=A0AAF3EVM4_9BILA
MFYAQFVLAKKGPLAKIWLAAHWEKKLTKAQIYETDVEEAVDEILKPKVKIALRTTGHLLLGIVRIYSRKTKYLLADCNETFLRLRMTFRPGQSVETVVIDKEQEIHLEAITLPEVYANLDAAIPELDDLDFQTQFDTNQSRYEEITLNEIYDKAHQTAFGADFGMDDFGESQLQRGPLFNIDEPLFGGSLLEQRRDESGRLINASRNLNNTSELYDGQPKNVNIFGAEDFEMQTADGNLLNLDAPGSLFNDLEPMDFGMPENQVQHELTPLREPANENDVSTRSSFELGPVDVDELANQQQGRNRRRRKLVVDQNIKMSDADLKKNMDHFTDTLKPMDLAPPSKRLMQLREYGNADLLFQQPASDMMRSSVLKRRYQEHLIPRIRDDQSTRSTGLEIREELEMAEDIEQQRDVTPAMQSFLDNLNTTDLDMPAPPPEPFTSFNEMPIDMLDIDQENNPFGPEFGQQPRNSEIDRDILGDISNVPEPKRAKTEEPENNDTNEVSFTKRTNMLLHAIVTKLDSNVEGYVKLDAVVATNATKKEAARSFYELLVLKKFQAVDIKQDEPYGAIRIMKGNHINSFSEHQIH